MERVPRVVGTRNGLPLLADGRVLDVANVIWCTGYHLGIDWIDLPVFDEHGQPRQHRGVVAEQPRADSTSTNGTLPHSRE